MDFIHIVKEILDIELENYDDILALHGTVSLLKTKEVDDIG